MQQMCLSAQQVEGHGAANKYLLCISRTRQYAVVWELRLTEEGLEFKREALFRMCEALPSEIVANRSTLAYHQGCVYTTHTLLFQWSFVAPATVVALARFRESNHAFAVVVRSKVRSEGCISALALLYVRYR